jgi:hypothetical protein
MESIQQTLNGTTGFDKRVTCQISRNGDLIHRVWLVMKLPSDDTKSDKYWTDYIGLRVIKFIELEIGGQRIDKHYPEWMYIWNDLSLPEGKVKGYKMLVNGSDHHLNDGRKAMNSKTTLYVPLEFWFCRNVGLALPLIALQYHEVKLNIEFNSRAACFYDTGADLTTGELSAELWVDYIFLDTDERRRFAQLSHEYLIEQLQFTGEETLNSTAGSETRVKLNFNHPCKELVWVCPPVTLSSNQWTMFTSGSGSNTSNVVDVAKLQLNGQDRFAERPGEYFSLVQPFQHHERIPDNRGINVYSFALKPEEHQPSGTLNMSRIDTAFLSVKTKTGVSQRNIKIFATNYNVLRIMSGMGGLNILHSWIYYFNYCCNIWAKKQQFTTNASSCCGKHFAPRKSPRQLLVEGRQTPSDCDIPCCSGNPLEPFLPRRDGNNPVGQEQNLGTVIMKRIGQSACLLPNGVTLAYGRASETERVWVVNEGISNPRRLKIQSIPLGKLRGIRGHIPTKCFNLRNNNKCIKTKTSFLPAIALL